ncbi:MAG TPA: hypothetical protein ENK82_10215, partial [Campylobacterales bacterium]|nr:hypothetical protein [Campylobacterales bacterium]
MKTLFIHFLLFFIVLIISLTLFFYYGKDIWHPYYKQYSYKETIKVIEPEPCEECTLTHVGPLRPQIVEVEKECPPCPTPPEEKLTSKQKLNRHLADANFVVYPKNLILIGLKHERLL